MGSIANSNSSDIDRRDPFNGIKNYAAAITETTCRLTRVLDPSQVIMPTRSATPFTG